MSLLDDVFKLLEMATRLEENYDTKIEAATKYYEAVYLMRQYIQRLPSTAEQQQKRELLESKAFYYEQLAQKCLKSCNSTVGSLSSPCSDAQRSIASDPRSPIAKNGFFNEDASGIPIIPVAPSAPAGQAAYHQQRELLRQQQKERERKEQEQKRLSVLANQINQMTSQANAKLTQAMDVDEAGNQQSSIPLYMAAAELYLKSLRASEQNTMGMANNVTKVLKRRLEQTLDRVEQLKQAKNKNTPTIPLVQARKQRQVSVLSSQSPAPSLSPEEISVLKRSSLISSGLFLPWSEEEAQALSVAPKYITKLFRDPEGDLKLADKQKKSFYKWARPSEILLLRQHMRGMGGTSTPNPAMVLRSVSPYNIRQYGVTDCSFVASLCICAAYERRFQKSLISPIVYPQSPEGTMVYNPEGKYMVKLWLNGVARQVIVDDRLPIDKHGNLLCAQTKCPPGMLEIYVAIIEKAFLKMAGGYDFPGSNSGVDLYSLTGWIPERILFPKDPSKVKDHETPPERAWDRLMSAHAYGDCLITMSSDSTISEKRAEELGLITGHSYAVLNVMQTKNGTRLLLLKNPWANKGWKGRFSCYDTANWSDPAFCAELGYNPELDKQQDDGVSWICWEDALVYYQNIHLSWNPALFSHSASRHGFWPEAQGPADDTFNCGENPQYIMKLSEQAIKKGASIWILVSRHVTKQEQEGSDVKDYLTVHLHKNDSSRGRIWYPRTKKTVLTGAYTNNPHCLVRYDVTDSSEEYLSIVMSQYEKSHDLGYTLSCFCTEAFSLGSPARELPCSRTLTSSWTSSTAGGPIGKKSYYRNPMFAVEIPAGGSLVELHCLAPKTLAVNVLLCPVDAYGQRLKRIQSEPPCDSGNYRHGFAVTSRSKLEAGAYALVVSSYSPGETGNFRCKVLSSAKLRIDPILL